MTFEKIHVIINPASGQPEPVLHTINKVFCEHHAQWTASVTTPHLGGADLARRAVAAGADLIVVYGGDGTVKAVINGVIDSDVPLALLHGGTGNALAHELRIPVKLTDAVALIWGEHTFRTFDLGQVVSDARPDQPGYFALRASVGLQTEVLELATPELKERFGNFAYLMASLQSLSASETKTYHLTIDGEAITGQGITCIVSNSAFIGGRASFSFAPAVDPSDGLLDVFIVDASIDAFVSGLADALALDLAQFAQHYTGREIAIRIDPAQMITLDGEPFEHTPAAITVVPQAARIIVPA